MQNLSSVYTVNHSLTYTSLLKGPVHSGNSCELFFLFCYLWYKNLYVYLNFSKLRVKLGLKPLEVPDSTEDKGEKLADSWVADG